MEIHFMGLFYRLLGFVSAVNAVLCAWRIYYVPLNWIALAALAWHTFAAGRQLSEVRPAWDLSREQVVPIARMTLSTGAIALFVICTIRRNIIFRLAAWPLGSVSRSRDLGEEPRRATGLRFTGKVRRAQESLPLRDCPVVLNVAETGEILLEARLEDMGGWPDYFSTPGQDLTGTWSIMLSREGLKGGLEEGTFYPSFRARPALRLARPETRELVILSLPNTTEFLAFLGAVDEIVADSLRKEAILVRRVTEVATEVPPAKNREGDVNWGKLIDFSG
jgi:hypothetical protein